MKYPIGIQQFEKIRTGGYVYVDKTAHIYNLSHRGCYFFLSRPRRFGKSLLISTMDAYFSGRKELFEGLAIAELETEWIKHPILHLDLNTGKYETEDELEAVLDASLSKWEQEYGKDPNEKSPHFRFLGIVRRAYEKTGQRVVILVDEYDKPLLQAIGNEKLQDAFRSTLKAFYSVLKTQDGYIHFAFLTGVTKFGKVSVFSDLNNLEDLSLNRRYADLCGITEEEMHTCFGEAIRDLATENNMSCEEACDKLKELYDGYHFGFNTTGVYNPYSLLHAFKNLEFGSYWFATGTPTFLVELMKYSNYPLQRIQEGNVTVDVLNSIDSMSRNPIPVIYQSGYLTIKDYDQEFKHYTLGFPNKEVEEGFVRFLLPYYTPQNDGAEFFVENFVRDVRVGNVEQFMQRMVTFFSSGDYQVAGNMELYFQNCMWIVFRMMGLYTEVERHTSNGRIDVTLKTKDYIYIIELKLDGSAEEALRQIDDNGYAAPFAMDPRKLYKIGVNFSSSTRSIEEYIIREE